MSNDSYMSMITQTSAAKVPPPNIKRVATLAPEPGKPITRRRGRIKMYFYALLVVAIIGASVYGYCNYVYSKGGYSGYIRKVSTKGFIKTWEGELDKRKMGGTYSEQDIFRFSVQDETVAKRIQDAEQSGEWVTIHYKQYLVTLPWRGKTPYIIHDVTHAAKKEKE